MVRTQQRYDETNEHYAQDVLPKVAMKLQKTMIENAYVKEELEDRRRLDTDRINQEIENGPIQNKVAPPESELTMMDIGQAMIGNQIVLR